MPEANDEKLFNEARKWVIATHQVCVDYYNENLLTIWIILMKYFITIIIIIFNVIIILTNVIIIIIIAITINIIIIII